MHSELLNTTTCDICGYPNARIRQITRTYGKGQDLLVIENVPVVNCPQCETSYLTAETLKKIDLIRRDPLSCTVERPVAVTSF